MPAVFFSDGDHDPGRFPGFENDHHRIVLGVLKVGIDKVIPPPVGRIEDRHAPFLATILEPVLILLSDIAYELGSNSQALAVGIKETDHSFGLLKRLNQPVQKNAVQTTIAKFDAILMVFAEGVHRLLQVVRYQELIALNASATSSSMTGYQGRSPWLVSPQRPGIALCPANGERRTALRVRVSLKKKPVRRI